jgi:hypothetical protein
MPLASASSVSRSVGAACAGKLIALPKRRVETGGCQIERLREPHTQRKGWAKRIVVVNWPELRIPR